MEKAQTRRMVASTFAICLVLTACEKVPEDPGQCVVTQSDQEVQTQSTELATRFIVKLKPGKRLNSAKFSQMGFDSKQLSERVTDLAVVTSEQPTTAREIVDSQGLSEDVEYAEPDYVVNEVKTLNDPSISLQWAHSKVQSSKAWDITMGSASVVVAIVDSGADLSHPDLAANLWKNPKEIAGNGKDDDGNGYVDDINGWDFVGDDNNPYGGSDHGMHVAGTIAGVGNNGKGIAGHAPGVKVMPLRFLDSNGSGYTSNAIEAIDYAIKMGAKVINNSWGGSGFSQSLSDAIGRAKNAGVLFVAAAGNNSANNNTSGFYPANYSHANVVSVASTTSGDKLSSFSNYGSTKVHVAAPGSSIYSTLNGGAYGYKSGTSMASPLVSGVAALLFSARADLGYADVKNALITGSDPVTALKGLTASNGRVNAYASLLKIVDQVDPVPPVDPEPPTPNPCSGSAQ